MAKHKHARNVRIIWSQKAQKPATTAAQADPWGIARVDPANVEGAR